MDVNGSLQEAVTLHQAGRLAEAEALYRHILEAAPGQPDALHLLGLIANAAGHKDAAIALVSDAVAARPAFPLAHYNLGRILHGRGRFAEAEASYRRAIAFQPDYADAHNNLGGALHAQGRQLEAVASYEQALKLRPEYAEAHSNLGAALQDLRRFDQAIASYQRALAIKPDYVEALHNLGEVLQDEHRLDEAVDCYERALALQPDHASAHCGLSFALLRRGDLPRGWAEYEWRWRRADYAVERRDLPGTAWDGDDPRGRTILLYAEQGFGDTLQFSRYVPMVAARGADVIVECQPALTRLLSTLGGARDVIPRGEPLPAFDLHAPLLSLPHLFGTALDSVPAAVPYLQPPAGLADQWQGRLLARDAFRVGIAWASNPANDRPRAPRSMPLVNFAALARVPGVVLFSVQKGPGSEEAAQPPAGVTLVDLAPHIVDFADTAAAMAHLDLVITVDTAIAHLAGALGRPVWVVLPFASEWRWLLGRDDSLWYPTMRLFRQQRAGDWSEVMELVAQALRSAAGAAGNLGPE